MDFSNSTLTPLVATASWILGLSVLAQVIQELWKFVTSSKSRAFEQALVDFTGTWVLPVLQRDYILAVRGPLQFRRVSTAGRVLPTEQSELLRALEGAGTPWHRLVLQVLDEEAKRQNMGS